MLFRKPTKTYVIIQCVENDIINYFVHMGAKSYVLLRVGGLSNDLNFSIHIVHIDIEYT